MARKKLPPELKAKNHTFKLYDWEVEKVKEYIKQMRLKIALKSQPVRVEKAISEIPINIEVREVER
jgi:hypothetical protein